MGLQPAASAVSSGSSSVRCRQRMEGITRSSSRAAANVAIRRAAPCTIAPSDRFTPANDELCSVRRLASRHGCCARLLSPSAVCTPADDHTRTRSSSCPSPASTRPCTSHAAINRMSRAITGGGSSFRTAASCICRVAGVIHLSDAGRGWRELHDWAAEQQQPLRFVALHRAQYLRPAHLPLEQTSYAAVGASRAVAYAAPDQYLRRRVHPTR